MLVCHCAVVHDRRVREVIAAGARDVAAVAHVSRAGAFCGGCVPAIAAILAEETGRPAGGFLAPRADEGLRAPVQHQLNAVVRGIEEDIVRAGWRSGERIGTEDRLAPRYRTTRRLVRRAVVVLEQHGVLTRVEDGSLVVGAPRPAAPAEAAAVHLAAVGVTPGELEDARRAVDAAGGGAAAAVLAGAAEHTTRPPDGGDQPASLMALARALAGDAHRAGLQPGDAVGHVPALAERHGVRSGVLGDACTLLDYYAVATEWPGSARQVVLGEPDPWPAAQLVALYLARADETRGAELAALRRALDVPDPDEAAPQHPGAQLAPAGRRNRALGLFATAVTLADVRRDET